MRATPPTPAAPPITEPPRRRRASPGSCAASRGWSRCTSCSRAPTSAPRAAGCATIRSTTTTSISPTGGCTDGWRSAGQPPNENDWAKVDVFKLKDGRELRGTYGSRTGGPVDRFYPLRGTPETVPESRSSSRSSIRYVSFPPFPAVLMVPLVAIWGLDFNDVLFTALWAALNPVLLLLLLRDLRRRGLSRRSDVDDLWLVAMFGVGSVYYYCSVVGQVWFTALIVGVTLAIGYAWASLDAERPVLAGHLHGSRLRHAPALAGRSRCSCSRRCACRAAGPRCARATAGETLAAAPDPLRRCPSRPSAPSCCGTTMRASSAPSSSATAS